MSDRRVVSKERGERIAIDHGVRFLETSAKANINIDKAFYDLAEAILDNVNLLTFKLVCILITKFCKRIHFIADFIKS